MRAAGAESVSVFGDCKLAVVVRPGPSILPADFTSGLEIGCEDVTFWMNGLKADAIVVKRCQFEPPTHPSANTATKAAAASQALRRRSPACFADNKTSSRLRLDKSNG